MKQYITSLITRFLSRPVEITEGARAFAESSLGITDPRKLAEFMQSEEAEDSGLIQLLLHPPSVLKEAAEKHIPPEGFSRLEISEIKETLTKEVKAITIIDHETGTSGALAPAKNMIKQFLADLRLDAAVPNTFPGIRGSEPRIPIPPRIRYRLRRHWHRLTSEAQKQIMILAESLAEESNPENEASLLDRSATLLGRIQDTDDPYEIISRQKQSAEKLIDAIRYFEEMQKKYSMDILMSMRLTPPPENYDDLLSDIIMLDQISRILFGIPARGRAPEENIAMDGKNNLKNLW